MRTAEIRRTSKETEIQLSLNLDGNGKSSIQSGVGFLDHMLTLFASHGRFDLQLSCKGDIWVDDHHTVEDIAICLGDAVREALGDKRGITRYGSMLLPMDEALILCAIDLSGRPFLCAELEIPAEKVGNFDTELVVEFLQAFASHSQMTLHVRQMAGKNSHHIIEGVFKALARALSTACATDPRAGNEIPSTKGIL